MEITIEHAKNIILLNNQINKINKLIDYHEQVLPIYENITIRYIDNPNYNFSSSILADDYIPIELVDDDYKQIKQIILSRLKILRDKKSLELFELQFPKYDKLNDQKI